MIPLKAELAPQGARSNLRTRRDIRSAPHEHPEPTEPEPKAGPAVAATGPRRSARRAAGRPTEAGPADPEAGSGWSAGHPGRTGWAEPAALVNSAGNSLADPGFGRGFALFGRRGNKGGRGTAD